MGFGTQKLLASVGAISFGDASSLFTAETAVTIASAATWTVPYGYQIITGDGSHAVLQYSPNQDNATPSWRQMNTTGYCGDCYSDGFCLRVSNSFTAAITIWYYGLK